VRESPLGNFFRPGNLVNDTRGQNWAKGHYRRAGTNSSDPPLQRVEYQFPPPSHHPSPPFSVAAFVVNSEPPHLGTSLGPFVCGARVFSLSSFYH
jgi:hypothetical protein